MYDKLAIRTILEDRDKLSPYRAQIEIDRVQIEIDDLICDDIEEVIILSEAAEILFHRLGVGQDYVDCFTQ